MDKIYLVKYSGGSYDDYYNAIIFATKDKKTATKYVTKFNRILKKWKAYYSQFEDNRYGWRWIKDEYVQDDSNDYIYQRWSSLRRITNCYYEEVSVR